MKKIMFWLVLIVGIVVLIGSCKKDDDKTTTTASCAGSTRYTTITSCSDTADGGITGIDNATLSGTFSNFHVNGILGGYSVDNSTDVLITQL